MVDIRPAVAIAKLHKHPTRLRALTRARTREYLCQEEVDRVIRPLVWIRRGMSSRTFHYGGPQTLSLSHHLVRGSMAHLFYSTTCGGIRTKEIEELLTSLLL